MHRHPSPRFLVASLLMVLFAVGCNKPSPFKLMSDKPRSDKNAPVDPPNSYPEWTYDAPQTMKPAADLTPEPRAREEDPLHYFTNKKLVPIRQPSGYKPEEIPRVAVWYTDNNGFDWKKGGYFGQSQTFFWFDAPADGDYGVRFVGPGQEPSKVPVAEPVRVYHVDTTLPTVELIVDPNQAWYRPGQTISLSWKAQDYHLVEQPVEIGVATDFSSEHPSWTVLQKDLDASGNYSYTIPSDATGRGLTFRAAARDRAGNVGVGFSHLIQVQDEPNQSDKNATPPPQQTAQTPTVAPSGTFAPVALSPPPPLQPVAAPQTATIDSGKIETIQPDGWTPMDSTPVKLISAPQSAPIAPAPAPVSSVVPVSQSAPPAAQPLAPPSPPTELKIEEVAPAGGQQSAAPPSADIDLLFDRTPPSTPPAQAAAPVAKPIDAVSPPVIKSSTVTELIPTSPVSAPPAGAAPASGSAPTAPPLAAPAASPMPSTPEPAAKIESVPQQPQPAPVAPPKLASVTLSSPPPQSHGGLVAPLPGTGAQTPSDGAARPWQTLKKPNDRKNDSVWALPKPAFLFDAQGAFERQLVTKNTELTPVAPGASTDKPVAEADIAPRDSAEPVAPK